MFTIHHFAPGGLCKTYHASLGRVLETLRSHDAAMDDCGWFCRNIHGQAIRLAVFHDDDEVSPADIARACFGEFKQVEEKYGGPVEPLAPSTRGRVDLRRAARR